MPEKRPKKPAEFKRSSIKRSLTKRCFFWKSRESFALRYLSSQALEVGQYFSDEKVYRTRGGISPEFGLDSKIVRYFVVGTFYDCVKLVPYLVKFSTAALAAPVCDIIGNPRNISQTMLTIAFPFSLLSRMCCKDWVLVQFFFQAICFTARAHYCRQLTKQFAKINI